MKNLAKATIRMTQEIAWEEAQGSHAGTCGTHMAVLFNLAAVLHVVGASTAQWIWAFGLVLGITALGSYLGRRAHQIRVGDAAVRADSAAGLDS